MIATSYSPGGTPRGEHEARAPRQSERGRLGRGRAWPRALIGIALAWGVLALPAAADASSTVVSLTFDDGWGSQYANARSILQAHQVNGTFYVNSNRLGNGTYMTWSQLHGLAADGNEVGGHTLDHVNLTQVSSAEQRRQICDDRLALSGQGFQPTDFAYPYGALDNSVKATVQSCGYVTAREVGQLTQGGDCANAPCPYAESIPAPDPYALRNPGAVVNTTTLSEIEGWVTQAQVHGGGWLGLELHQVCSGPQDGDNGNCGPYSITPANLSALLDWLSQQNIAVKTVAQVYGAATATTAPSVATQPADQSASVGGSASFTAGFAGAPTPAIQWQLSTNAGTTFNAIPGATSATLTLNAVSASQDGTLYRAVGFNSAGTATSRAAKLTVNTAPSVATQPADQSASVGGSASFTAGFAGAPTPAIQWQLSSDGGITFSAIAGATSATLTLTSLTASQDGTLYRAVGSNSAGAATSTAAKLTVNTVPTVPAQPADQSASVGGSASFTVGFAGAPTPTRQWQLSSDGGITFSAIAGATSATLTLNSLTASQDGTLYRAVGSNSAGGAASTAAELHVTSATRPATTPTPPAGVTPSGPAANSPSQGVAGLSASGCAQSHVVPLQNEARTLRDEAQQRHHDSARATNLRAALRDLRAWRSDQLRGASARALSRDAARATRDQIARANDELTQLGDAQTAARDADQHARDVVALALCARQTSDAIARRHAQAQTELLKLERDLRRHKAERRADLRRRVADRRARVNPRQRRLDDALLHVDNLLAPQERALRTTLASTG